MTPATQNRWVGCHPTCQQKNLLACDKIHTLQGVARPPFCCGRSSCAHYELRSANSKPRSRFCSSCPIVQHAPSNPPRLSSVVAFWCLGKKSRHLRFGCPLKTFEELESVR